jgi:hypothetical protein
MNVARRRCAFVSTILLTATTACSNPRHDVFRAAAHRCAVSPLSASDLARSISFRNTAQFARIAIEGKTNAQRGAHKSWSRN